jgi:hypothetical protein
MPRAAQSHVCAMTIRSQTTEPIDLRGEWRDLQRRIVELIRGDQLLELDPQIYTDPERYSCTFMNSSII